MLLGAPLRSLLHAGEDLQQLVLLDRDITKVSPAEILKTKILRTVVGGKTVYEATFKQGNDVIGVTVDADGNLVGRHSEKQEHK